MTVIEDDKGSYIPSFEVYGKYENSYCETLLQTFLEKSPAELFLKRLNKNKKRYDLAHKISTHYSDLFLEKYSQKFAGMSFEEHSEKETEYQNKLYSMENILENIPENIDKDWEKITEKIDEATQNDLEVLIKNHPAIFSIWKTYQESHFDSFEIRESKAYASWK